MDYLWMLKPAEFKDVSEEDIVEKIGQGLITQQGVQIFPQEHIAKNWAEDAKKEGYICVRRETYTELYKKKKK